MEGIQTGESLFFMDRKEIGTVSFIIIIIICLQFLCIKIFTPG